MRKLCAFLVAMALAGCGHLAPATVVKPLASKATGAARTTGIPRFVARNAYYRVDARVGIQLADLDADITQHGVGAFVPGDKAAFDIDVHHVDATISASSLEALVGTYVFGDEGAPVKDVKVSVKGDRLVLAGKLKKVIWVPFSCEGGVAPMADGRIRFTPTNVTAAGVRVDGLMQLVGLEIAKVFELRKDKGITIAGNDFVLDVAGMIPPPRMTGRVTAAAIANGALALTLDNGTPRPALPLPVPGARNYLAIWGGNVRLGSATLADAKVQVLDADPSDPLTFALERFADALEAGTVDLLRDGGVIAYIPDLRRYDQPLGRFTPPSLPVPGIPAQAPAGTIR
ncbi:MAG: hypothetical protein JWM80_4498 [Cyanobacteria bacterium RYN_339]|nr:hypothetical protein [Cyanobacteria bacterium RYN_339]